MNYQIGDLIIIRNELCMVTNIVHFSEYDKHPRVKMDVLSPTKEGVITKRYMYISILDEGIKDGKYKYYPIIL